MAPTTPYTPGFDYDVFVSYSHVDNQPGTTGKRWVDEFHAALDRRLAIRVGRLGAIRIWRDDRLDGGQLFDAVIEQRIARSAVFLALDSQGYLASDYCQKELRSFCEQAERSQQGLEVGERRRAVHVLLSNLRHSVWPARLGGATGFHFHDGPQDERIDDTRIGEPLDSGTPQFAENLRALTDAIYWLLEAMKARRPGTTDGAPAQPSPYVYLADTADTLADVRQRLAADLQQSGRVASLGVPPPYQASDHATEVRRRVQGAQLSVHLLDVWPGRVVDGDAETTYPRKQVEIAGETGTPQLVWMPPSVDLSTATDDRYQQFLRDLERGGGRARAHEFVRAPAESLGRLVLDKLQSLESRLPLTSGSTNVEPPGVLLDTHVKDQLTAFRLGTYLGEQGIQPFINQDTDDPLDGIRKFESQLTRVRAVVVFFGRVSQAWMEQRIKCAIQFVAGQLTKDVEPSLEALYVYVLPPQTQAPVIRRSPFNISILDARGSDGFDPEALAPLLRVLTRETNR